MSMILLGDIQAHKKGGSWRVLQRRALEMVADATRSAGATFEPRLGGGTRLMLDLDHRISHDIDLFIREPVERLARLLKTRYSEIERSLEAIVRSANAKVMWEAILAVEKPDLAEAAGLAKASLNRYAGVSAEVARRVTELSALSQLAGPAYSFWKLADAEIRQAGSFDRVDWGSVELATIRESIGVNGQSPDSVADALCQYSPGAVTVIRQIAVRDIVKAMSADLLSEHEGKSRDDIDGPRKP